MHVKVSLLAVAILCSPAFAQKPADPWLEKKASRFKPIDEKTRSKIVAALPNKPTVQPEKERRILCFYRCDGFIHGSIPYGNLAMQEAAKKTGAFQIDLADTYDVFTKKNLAKYDAILLNNTTHMKFPEPRQQNAFMDFVADGGGLIGFHAASDNFGRHPECLALIGGIFNGHPWGSGGTWAFKLDDQAHPLNAAFGGQGFWHQDEIYQYKSESYVGPQKLRILLSLDMSKEEVASRIDDGPREVPVSWIRTAGEGRVFYTNFGHRAETFHNPMVLRHMLDGIQYALGDLQADATPTAHAKNLRTAAAPKK